MPFIIIPLAPLDLMIPLLEKRKYQIPLEYFSIEAPLCPHLAAIALIIIHVLSRSDQSMNNLYILPFHIARVCSASSHEYRSKSEATPSEKKSI